MGKNAGVNSFTLAATAPFRRTFRPFNNIDYGSFTRLLQKMYFSQK